jgi:O-antigen/teichoic acid export membrane protein
MFFIIYLLIGIISLGVGIGLYLNVDALFGKTMTDVEQNKARIMILILIFNLAFTFPMSIFGSIMTAYERFIFPRIINIIRIVLNTIVMVLLLKMGYRAIAMVVVQTVFNVLTLIINYFYCKKELSIKLKFKKFKWGFLKEVSIYSFWILLNVIMDKIYWNTGQFVLGAVSGTIAVSVFAVAIQLESMYMQFSVAISSVFLPKVTAMVTKKSSEKELSDLFIRTGRLQYIVMCFIFSGFIVFGKPFIYLWAGPEYSEAYYMTLLFFGALLIPLIQNLGITILQAKNEMKFRSILYVIIAIAALIVEIILSKVLGGIGCAIAIAGALLLGHGLIMNIYYDKKLHLDISTFWKEIILLSIFPTIMVIVSLVLLRNRTIGSWYTLFEYIFLFSITYIPLFFIICLKDNEKLLLLEPVRRVLKINKKHD